MARILLFLCLYTFTGAEELVPEGDFSAGALDNWHSFSKGTVPNVEVIAPGILKGRRSDHGGLVALSRTFKVPQERIQIDFSLAVSKGSGRVFHIWSQDPEGEDASQLNLCVQRGRLQHYDGRTRTWESVGGAIKPSADPSKPIWHRVKAIVDSKAGTVDVWLSSPGKLDLSEKPTATMAAYRSDLPIAGISFVSGTRIAKDAWYLVDDLTVQNGDNIPAPGALPSPAKQFQLWNGPAIPSDPDKVPFAEGIEHRLIHRPDVKDDKFLHGAAIVKHKGIFYANWANSPTNENGPHESLRGKRSRDNGKTWSPIEIVGPDLDGPDRRSHGVLFVHDDQVWTIGARFGAGGPGKLFPGLKGEVFVLDEEQNRWISRGIVIDNCWPYDEPVKMGNGNFITGGQDRDGLPVVAISQGADIEKQWKSIHIPYPPKLAPRFAETTVWADGAEVLAVIRGGQNTAWVATSKDSGETWTEAQPSNLPMPRSKAILGRLSNGQLYLVSNLKNRDTLVISVGEPGKTTLSRMFRLRHGRSEAPRYKGKAKGPQWSYPNAFEADGKLYVVYSIGKEDCGLTIIPISSLQ